MAAVDRRGPAIQNVARHPTAGARVGGCSLSRRRMNLKSSADAGRRSYQPVPPLTLSASDCREIAKPAARLLAAAWWKLH
jgi:hypothetical protein